MNSETTGKPVLVITLGPTGSGKGGALTKLKEIKAYRDKLDSVVVTGVDEIVVEHQHYKQEMKKFLEDKLKDIIRNKENIKKLIFSLTKPEYDKIEKIYFEARYVMSDEKYSKPLKHGCEFDAKNTRYMERPNCKSLKRSCEKKNDNQILAALTEGSNLLIESTGASYPEWLLEEKKKSESREDPEDSEDPENPEDQKKNKPTFAELLNKKKYQVIFVWNYVQICILVERILNRTIEQIITFLENPNVNKAPRFPNFLRLIEELPSIYETFESKETLNPKEGSRLEYINYYNDNTPGLDDEPNSLVKLETKEDFQNKYEGYNRPASNFLDSEITGIELFKSWGIRQEVCDGYRTLVKKIKEKLIQQGKKNAESKAVGVASVLMEGGGMKKKKRTSGRRSKNKRVGKRKYKKTKRLHRKKRKTKKLN